MKSKLNLIAIVIIAGIIASCATRKVTRIVV